MIYGSILTVKFKICRNAGYDSFKSNEPTLNMLLPIINEKIFYNDGVPNKVPLLGFYCASNETPEEGEGLEALYDRLVNKVYVEYIKDDNNKLKMFESSINNRKNARLNPNKATITIEEVVAIQKEVNNVTVDKKVLKSFLSIINSIKRLGIVFSDRRQNECIRAIQAEALLNGRDNAIIDDLIALKDILWENKKDIESINEIVDKIADPYSSTLIETRSKFNEIINDINNTSDQTAKTTKAIEAKKGFEKLTNTINKLLNNAPKNSTKHKKVIDDLNNLKKEIIASNEKILATVLDMDQSNGGIFGNDDSNDSPIF